MRRRSLLTDEVIWMEEDRCKVAAASTEDTRCLSLVDGIAIELEDRRCKGLGHTPVIEIEDSRCSSLVIQMEDSRCGSLRARW
jgi:hypothetical protein